MAKTRKTKPTRIAAIKKAIRKHTKPGTYRVIEDTDFQGMMNTLNSHITNTRDHNNAKHNKLNNIISALEKAQIQENFSHHSFLLHLTLFFAFIGSFPILVELLGIIGTISTHLMAYVGIL